MFVRRHKQRWLGLIYCAWPCHNGTDYLTDDLDWYDTATRAYVRALGQSQPNLADEYQRSMVSPDHGFIVNFGTELGRFKAQNDRNSQETREESHGQVP